MKKIFFVLLAPLLLSGWVSGQSAKIDSLRSELIKAVADSSKVILLNAIGKEIMYRDVDSALVLGKNALHLAERCGFKKGMADSENNIGAYLLIKGDYALSLSHLIKALEIRESIRDTNGISMSYANIGAVYKKQSEYKKALEYYYKGLSLTENILAKGNNIREKDVKRSLATIQGNIGNIFNELATGSTIKAERDSLFDIALDWYNKALKIEEVIGNIKGISTKYGNIGTVYMVKGEMEPGTSERKMAFFNHALEWYLKALNLDQELGNKPGIARNCNNIGGLFLSLKRFSESEGYFLRALSINDEFGAFEGKKHSHEGLYKLYSEAGDYKKALFHHVEFSKVKDTLFNIEKHDDMTRNALNYEFSKKEAVAKAEYEKNLAITEVEKKRQKIVIWFAVTGLLLVALILVIVARSLNVARKQKQIIQHQKQIVDEKNKEIIDSITYSKRLQDAILPPLMQIKEQFPDSFILYKPKDIVAGDFYWMEVVNGSPVPGKFMESETVNSPGQAGKTVFIAVADCTGHGVPGAMVSVVCSNALNRAVKEFGLTETGRILDKVTDLVLETFEKSIPDVKDGMDISLLSIRYDTGNARQIAEIKWSGANNPLWYFAGNRFHEIKADKQPVGKYDNRKSFITHNIGYIQGTVFYLFTDGFPDQFGGPKGKKFKYRQLEEILSTRKDLLLEEQEKILDKTFYEWKGGLEQVDDITVIGIKV